MYTIVIRFTIIFLKHSTHTFFRPYLSITREYINYFCIKQ
jgi:hypothetical protein